MSKCGKEHRLNLFLWNVLLCFRYQGHISAALVLGGVDTTGPHLTGVHPHGSTDTLPYTTMGTNTDIQNN